jgi:hypothetical protein
VAQRVVDAVLAEARAEIAAGRFPDVVALRAQLAGDTDALARLDAVLAVHRARARIARKGSETTVPVTGSKLRTRPTINGDMDVRRAGELTLEWEPVESVATWEVRISKRPDVRGDYVLQQTIQVDDPSIDLPLDDQPLRVHVLGRTRNGRLVRRAVISGLTRESWNDRWQRR